MSSHSSCGRLRVACRAAIHMLMLAVPIWVLSAARAPAQAIVQQSSASLRPGDSLRVRVWREPDLSGVFMVDEHGDLTFPRLGRRSVVNVPIDSIRARVQREYAEFVRDASVEITPLYRVRVNGAVRNPGLFTVDPTMSVGDAIGLAGGISPEGRNGKVDLVRDGRRIAASISPSSRLVELALRSGDELYVPERAWLSRNTGLLLGGLSTVASLFWALNR
jgi:protein involved in polysaccharide export with SLBB domain